MALTTINLHWKGFERWSEGSPTLLVKDGRVLRRNLLKERVSMADLMTALRHKEVEDVSEVKEAWMEQAGGISVILKREAGPATPRDVERARWSGCSPAGCRAWCRTPSNGRSGRAP